MKYSRPDRWYVDNVDPITGKMNKLHRLEFRFNNKCNYACRHCSADIAQVGFKLIITIQCKADFGFPRTDENSIAQYMNLSDGFPT